MNRSIVVRTAAAVREGDVLVTENGRREHRVDEVTSLAEKRVCIRFNDSTGSLTLNEEEKLELRPRRM